MSTVTLEVAGLAEGLAAFRDAWTNHRPEDGARISFTSPGLLWQLFTAPRWDVLRAMAGQGPLTLDGIARRVGRDAESVRTDVEALADAGLLRRGPDGTAEFPYDAVHVDFMLRAA